MPSLRDKLNGYGASRAKPAPKPQSAECLRVFDRADKRDYGLSDVLSDHLLQDLTGQTFGDIALDKILFLDTETTGLSGGVGTIAFLVGIGYFSGDQFIVEQLLMRDYGEETDLLKRVCELMNNAQALVTFNGHTFDIPLLESRFTMCRLHGEYTLPPHIDLLPLARSAWRLRLKRCSLSALEEAVFGMKREDDLPGALVPKQYFDYLKIHDFSLIEPILKHNCQDIKSLPLLFKKLLALYETPTKAEFPADIYSVGRVMEKRGLKLQARHCYHASDKGSMSLLSRMTLADSLKRDKHYTDAAALYEKMIADAQGGSFPYIALAKLCEHHFSDPERALALTRRAMLYLNPYDTQAFDDAQKRALRLIKKCERKKNHGTV